MPHDADGLSKLSPEIEESADMIAFLETKYLCYTKGYTMQRVLNELVSIHRVQEDFARMKVEGWKKKREALRRKREAEERRASATARGRGGE